MDDESVIRIEILKEIPFSGEEDSLTNRLRDVSLRGFPDVKIYENAEFELVRFSPKGIIGKISTPQPSVYRTHLDRIATLDRLFRDIRIDIMDLDRAYDFISTSESGKQSEWTILPPIVERFFIPKTRENRLDYESLAGERLKNALRKEGLWFNPKVLSMKHINDGVYDLINDGSHRIHYGFERKGIKILRIDGMASGFPYYAAPQKYSTVKVYSERTLKNIDKKIHIIEEPGHKKLYRLFPSGGIMSGNVRKLP